VLVVDDDPLVLAATSRYLQRMGFHAIMADSPFGVSALIRKECPDVVVLDHDMPGLDGGHLLRLLRASPRTAATPVVLYSGDATGSVGALASSLGVGWARKGQGPRALFETVLAALATTSQPNAAAAHAP
jgi:CheY-like chemotaxis protein